MSAFRLPHRSWTLLATLLLAACSGGVSTQQSYEEGIDPSTGQPEESYSTNARLYGDKNEQRLEEAQALARAGQFPPAIETFESIAQDESVKTEVRSEALFSLGEAQGAVFNPNKNYETAIATLQRYLKLYPEGDNADEANDLIANYQKILEQYQD
jgi:outer membrane protein assembly factor BamD (BamD/ComL family)